MILISTIPNDIHACAVSLGAEAYGQACVRWYPAAIAISGDFSLNLNSSPGIFLGGNICGNLNYPIRTFWYRRRGKVAIPPTLHSADVDIALSFCEYALDSIMEHIQSVATLSVNPPLHTAQTRQGKFRQMKVAKEVGFRCPGTIVTNVRDEAARFIDRHGDCAIFKSFRTIRWRSEDSISINFASAISSNMLPSSDIMRSSPGIFQKLIEKSFELRVTVMGCYVVAAKLDSQRISDAKTDWRVAGRQVPVDYFNIDHIVAKQCVELTKRLGLVFACIDLVVDLSGRVWFLEVNQMGQFLWLEERCSSIPLLDTFVQFLLSADSCFQGPSSSPRIKYLDVRQDAVMRMAADLEMMPSFCHPSPHTYSE